MSMMYENLVKTLRGSTPNRLLLFTAADAIEELSRENESLANSVNEASDILRRRWIPVTERLPDRGKYLCLGGLDNPYHRILSFTRDLESVDDFDFKGEKRSGWYWYDSEYGYCEAKNITHWMPLPEPPKDGES